MAAKDLRVREQLASDGSLFEGYHPRMREVHERNAERLSAILNEHGWPVRSLVGEEAAQAAWLYRVIYRVVAAHQLFQVMSVTAHDYRRA
jgi:hypothetical protein